ncbi:MAG: Fic family protein [Chlamydiales bacterium]|nr:Fic family protein [Chlamydiales bacterium]
MSSRIPSFNKSLSDVAEQKAEKSGCFSFLGRTFNKLSSSLWQIAKISLLFSVTVRVPQLVAGNPALEPFRPFPDYMSRFMKPGLQLARQGTAGCSTNVALDTLNICNLQASHILTNLMVNKDDKRVMHFTEAELQKGYTEHGVIRYGVQADGTLIPFTFMLQPRRLENYEKAMHYAQDLLLKDANALQDSPASIISTLKKLHEILVNDLPESRYVPRGTYRDKTLKIVSTYRTHLTTSEIAKKYLSNEDYEIYANSITRQSRPGVIDSLTEKERAIWNKVFYIPIDFSEIEQAMLAFAQELQQRMQQGGDYIDHASFAHAKLTLISPFPAGVGRLARLLTNTILTIGNLPAVVFHDYERYAVATRLSTNNPEVFTKYLRDQLEWTNAHMNTLNAIPPACTMSQNSLDHAVQARYLFPGMQLVQGGAHACVIENPPLSLLQCDQTIAAQLKDPKMKTFLLQHESADTFSEKGISVTMPVDCQSKKMNFKINPKKYSNYITALTYVEELIAQNMQHFKQTAGKTIETIQHIHKLLTEGTVDNEPVTPGKFRTSWMIVDPLAQPEMLGARAKQLLSDEEFTIFAASYTHVQQDVTHLGRLSYQEAQLWDRVAYVTPPPHKVEHEMAVFAIQLYDRLTTTGQIDYIDLASFVHMQIARIWAFSDANGRLARILMNAMLRLGRIGPVVINNENAYMQAVDKGVRNQVAFTDYLRDHLIPWTQLHKATLGF